VGKQLQASPSRRLGLNFIADRANASPPGPDFIASQHVEDALLKITSNNASHLLYLSNVAVSTCETVASGHQVLEAPPLLGPSSSPVALETPVLPNLAEAATSSRAFPPLGPSSSPAARGAPKATAKCHLPAVDPTPTVPSTPGLADGPWRPPNSPAIPSPPAASFVQALMRSMFPPALPLAIHPPAFTDAGEPAVFFSVEEINISCKPLELAVIARTPQGRPPFQEIRYHLQQRFKFQEDFLLSALDKHHLLIKFQNKEDFLQNDMSPTDELDVNSPGAQNNPPPSDNANTPLLCSTLTHHIDSSLVDDTTVYPGAQNVQVAAKTAAQDDVHPVFAEMPVQKSEPEHVTDAPTAVHPLDSMRATYEGDQDPVSLEGVHANSATVPASALFLSLVFSKQKIFRNPSLPKLKVSGRHEVVCLGMLAPRKFMERRRRKTEVFKDAADEADQMNWRRLMREIENEGSVVSILRNRRSRGSPLKRDIVLGTLTRFKQLKKWNLVSELLQLSVATCLGPKRKQADSDKSQIFSHHM
ncbi:hypothetical protein Taro_026935, partial [Colocasia esculenta]|nr:hypothetical protein [Colocasia esculenta]